ncbi:MAG TPA: 2OG-Fe(II) oxygenase family protein [Ilumatobacter sp.]
MDLVPIIDIADPSDVALEAVDEACRDHGFFLLAGHGCDELIARTFAEGERFFAAPHAVRDAIRRDAQNPLGFNDRELTKRRRDHKQVFDFTDPEATAGLRANRWPDGLGDSYRTTLTEFFTTFSDLAARTVELVLEALGVPAADRPPYRGDRAASAVRINRYTVGDPVPDGERVGLADLGPTALGHHTDPGVLTLLLQDSVGGLQAESASRGWIDVAPRPGTVVVNLGDVMQVWSNDRYRAAVHRVVTMTTTSRMSIPYFFNPARVATIAPIPALAADQPRYRAFTWREFMGARNADNYADAGADDTQVSDFALV